MNSIQINKIENGWLIMTPPTNNQIVLGQQPQPVVHYVENKDELVAYIESLDI
jgi:hypothetical protein